jgi:serine/threonine protein kinase
MLHRHPDVPRKPDALIGRVVSDRYRIVRKLGPAGVAGLYFAEHLLVNRNVALKIILPEVRRPDVLREFLDQARTIARIGHENIAEIFCCGQSPDGFVFVAMEFLEGEDLGTLLAREGALPWTRVKAIVRQIVGALGPLHDHRIAHRDLTPENVFLTPRAGTRDFVKLLNFGVAQLTTASLDEGETGSGQLGSGSTYMSPELALAQPGDHRSDVYSLGCVMYHALTGTPPFQGTSVVDVVNKHIQDRPMPLRQRRPDLDIGADVDAIIMRALEKDPDRRFAGVAEMGTAIDQCRSASRRLIAFAAAAAASAGEDIVGRADELIAAARTRTPRTSRTPGRRGPSAVRLATATLIAALSCGAAAAVYNALHGF